MDAPSRNEQVETALHQLFRLIDDENFEAAEARIEDLASTLGEDDPEITRARSLLAFLRGEQ